MFDVVEEFLLKIGCRHVIGCVKERKKVLEHAAGGTAGRHKLNALMAIGKILSPLFSISLALLLRGFHNAFTHSGSSLYSKERETVLYLLQLMLHLLFRDTTL